METNHIQAENGQTKGEEVTFYRWIENKYIHAEDWQTRRKGQIDFKNEWKTSTYTLSSVAEVQF
jgi:hypothetical protein